MKTIQRYNIERTDDRYDESEMIERNDGQFVRWSDVEALLSSGHKFIFVAGGAVQAITDEHGQEGNDNIHLVDYDNMDGGTCPACGAEIVLDDDAEKFDPCDICGFDPEAGGDDENQRAIAAIMSLDHNKE